MKLNSPAALTALVATIIIAGFILCLHPKWNFPSDGYGYSVGRFWHSEWGIRVITNYVIGGSLIIQAYPH